MTASRRVIVLLEEELSSAEADLAHDVLTHLSQHSPAKQTSFLDEFTTPKRLCALREGFSLHAATHVRASDRKALFRLCHYGARGAIANARLTSLPDGRFAYAPKKGGAPLVFTGQELIARITPLIPSQRSHLTRYHGVFASRSRLRHKIVPQPESDDDTCTRHRSMRRKQEPIPFPSGTFLDVLPRRPPLHRARIPWHDLLRRTFGIDVLRCRNCNGSMRVLAVIQQSSVSRKILRHLGLPDAPPEVARSRAPPELAFAH